MTRTSNPPIMALFDVTHVNPLAAGAPLRFAPAGDMLSKSAAIGWPMLLSANIERIDYMKSWFFVQYFNALNEPAEYAVVHCADQFITDEMDKYLKFSGMSVSATAWKINAKTGKPTFTQPAARSRIPF